jgi:hypothetical protein
MKKLIFLNREILKDDEFTNCTIVPLNSVAMKDVLKNDMSYIKIEDFIDYEFCHHNKEMIWQVFQRLLDSADEIVSQIYGKPKLKNYGPFNLFAIKMRPSEIKLLTRKINFATSELAAARFLDTLHKIILESIAAKNNIEFMFHSLASKQNEYLRKIPIKTTIIQLILYLIKKLGIYYYFKIGIHETIINKLNEKAFFLQHNWGVYYYSQFFTHVINDSKFEVCVTNNQSMKYFKEIPCSEFLEKLQNEILTMNKLFGVDVKFIVEATVEGYIKKVPLIISRALRFEDYLNKLNPRFAFFTNLHEKLLPFQMALCWNNKIIKVMKDHGDSMLNATVWRNTELKPINLYFTEFKEFATYLKKNGEVANIKVRCEYDGVRLNKYYRKNKTKNKLIYVPGFFDPRMSFDMDMIPQPLFFRIQVLILQVLDQQEDFDDVVYKCLPPGQHDFHYPVPEYITRHFKNIKISYMPLEDELRDTRYCLLDTPSSSMWEAINMNVPCQTLIWKKMHLRHTGISYYKKFITLYESEEDVSEKLQLIIKMKRFYIIDPNEVKIMKRSPIEISDIFNEMLKLRSS